MSEFDDHGVRVEATAFYVADRSAPQQNYFFFAYRICIHNEGAEPVQLVSRHWIITDGVGRVQEVQGDGVVGEQPRLEPGESFEYTSFCPLPTPMGTMRGSYQMLRDDGSPFEAEIPAFTLATPQSLN